MIKTMLSLLIDGYNLLHALEKGFINSLQEKRDDLLTKLHYYQVQKNLKISVVFDGSLPSLALQSRDRIGELEIIYTDPETTADEWIAQACERTPGAYVVISSDNQVVRDAERFGCVTLSSQEFMRKLATLTKPIENPYLEDKEEDESSDILYPRVTTKKKGVSKRLPKKERRKFNQLKNL
jgi:predicted RNA-binding protein with PIN domain